MLLRDKVIVVTGAGSGIGRGIALAVAEEGGAVVALDLDLASARETAAAVEEGGAGTPGTGALPLAVDVTNAESVGAAIEMAVGRFDRLDGWVNNAGVLRMGPALESGDEDWVPQLEVNARALYSCCRLAARRMIDQGPIDKGPVDKGLSGAIVNVASNAGKVGYPNMAAYNASKAAVISLTRSLAAEWAEHGINVNAVCPGGVETPMLTQVAEWIGERQGLDPEALIGEMKPTQLGRHIQPIEVGRVVAFLLSDRGEIIRGQSINVDGGDTPY